MRRHASLLPAAFLVAAAMLTRATPAPAHDAADIPALVRQIEPATVALIAYQPKRRQATQRYDIMGAGCFVTAEGHILTADHVLRRIIEPEGHVRRAADLSRLAIGWLPDPATAKATIVTNARHQVVRVLRRNAGLDLALLHARIENATPVTLALDDAQTGTDIIFLGFPFGSKLGFRPLVNRGTLAGRRRLPGRTKDARRYGGYILDGSVHPGHSGSPVVDVETGAVIGLVQRRMTQTIPVAVSSAEIIAFLRDAGVTPITTNLGKQETHRRDAENAE